MSWPGERLQRVGTVSAHSRKRMLRARRLRSLRLELLEARTVMTALPFGATPDDTGEYMLGDVHVTVVLMESNNTIDNGTITYDANHPPTASFNYTPENWTQEAINAVKQNIETGVNWWKQTIDALPNVRDGLLNFTFDWTRLNTPVQTPFEPIARRSNDVDGNDIKWINSFLTPALGQAGLTPTGSISADIRKFNNYQRQQNDADWAFTIIVVNNANDADGEFAVGGSFRKAFSFAGGRYMVVPASRPASTYAHEAGHMFWALDEYLGGGTYSASRGYYNTPNTNAADNPESGFVQQASIMTNDVPEPLPPAQPSFLLSEAFNAHITSKSSSEMIGWRDTDSDGIFNVLDVPFELSGTGRFDSTAGTYRFTGSSSVRTLPNLNPSFLQNDITINRIREVQYAVDGGPWQVAQAFPERTYTTSLDLNIADSLLASGGSHTIKIRTIDTRTGAMSPEFVGTIGPSGTPQSVPSSDSGASGFVYFDSNGNGSWDRNEGPLVDWAVDLVDQFGTPIILQRRIEPNDYAEGAVLNGVHPEVTLSAVGGDVGANELQQLTIVLPEGGSVTPTYNGVLGSPLEFDSQVPLTAGRVASSLNSISALTGNILVSSTAASNVFRVTFTGGLARTNVSLIVQGEASGGASLASTAIMEGVSSTVFGFSSLRVPSAQRVFWNSSLAGGGFSEGWNTSRQFRADFGQSVSSVSIKALFATGDFGVGRLEAYSSSGVLLERFTSGVLTGGKSQVMTIARPTPDIAYIVAYGHLGSTIGLDTFTWGPRSSTTTNTLGAWSLPSLVSGTYRVKVIPPLAHIVTTPQGGQYEVGYTAGQTVGNLNFGIYNTDNIWHNIAFPENVNSDPQYLVNILDLLVLVNWLTTNGSGAPLPQTGDPSSTGYVDVNNDKVCSITDVLHVVNYLTLNPPGGTGGAGGEGETGGASLRGGMGLPGGSGGEGEESPFASWGGDDSLRVSLAYLESREDVHAHHDEGEHEEHGNHASMLETVADGLLTQGGGTDVDELDAVLAGDVAGAWLGSNLDSEIDSTPNPVASADESATPGALAGLPTAAVGAGDPEDLLPLARRKRLDRAVDTLAEDLSQMPAKIARILARGQHR